VIREFKHELLEVSHFQIGIKLPKLWNLEVQILVPILKPIGNTEKIEHEMGQIFDPRLNEIFECRLLENSTTNSWRYNTLKLGSYHPSYRI